MCQVCCASLAVANVGIATAAVVFYDRIYGSCYVVLTYETLVSFVVVLVQSCHSLCLLASCSPTATHGISPVRPLVSLKEFQCWWTGTCLSLGRVYGPFGSSRVLQAPPEWYGSSCHHSRRLQCGIGGQPVAELKAGTCYCIPTRR